MNDFASYLVDLAFVPWVLVKATALLALAWIAHVAFHGRNARWRVLVWRCTLAALVALPLAEWSLPVIDVSMQMPSTAVVESARPQAAELSVAGAPRVPAVDTAPRDVTPAGPSFSLSSWVLSNWLTLLVCAWAAGAALLFARMAAGWFRVRATLRQAATAPTPMVAQMRTVATALGVHRAIALRTLEGLGSPFLAGTLRPVIVLPAPRAGDDDPDRLRAIFAHELAHARSHDPLWMAAMRLASSMLWFHPLMWGVRAAHSNACEQVCDGVAAEHVGSAETYSRTLAREALALLSARPAPGGVPMLRSAEIVRRLRRIQRGIRVNRLGRRRAAIVLLTGAAVTAVIGGLRLVEAQREHPGENPRDYPHAIAVETYQQDWSHFQPGDAIEILEVRGTAPTFAEGEHYYVRGRYVLDSRDAAMLHVYATNGEVDSKQGPNVTRGSGEFVRTFTLTRMGMPHVNYYPVEGGDGFGGTYFRVSEDAASDVPASPPEMLEVEINVVDELGRPIEGARIVPDGLRAQASLVGHYTWMEDRHGSRAPVFTDGSGVARLAYPRFVEERRSTGQISFLVTHPALVGRRHHQYSVDGSEPPIVLVKGARIRVAGVLNGARVPADRLWVQVSAHEMWYDATNWSVDGDALVLNQQLPAKPHLVQVAYMPPDRSLLISETQTVNARVGEVYDLRLELKECARLEGWLDKSVPRPIQNGRVVLMVSPAFTSDEAGRLFWETWRDVNPDGSFVFELLPPGTVEITALCDGYRSQDGAPREQSLVLPQVRTLSRGANQVEVAMTPTAACEVTVLKPEGTPLQGAEVTFWPNTKWHIGTTIFAQRRIRMEEFVPGVGDLDALSPELFAFRSEDFSATTDENGVARVVNLVDGRHEFVVTHDDYLTPTNPRAPERRGSSVELTARETATVSVTMEPADAAPLDDSNSGQILASDASDDQ